MKAWLFTEQYDPDEAGGEQTALERARAKLAESLKDGGVRITDAQLEAVTWSRSKDDHGTAWVHLHWPLADYEV